jgi:hypothetical protein
MPIFAKSYNVSHTTIIRVIEAASKDYPLSPERMAGFLFVQSQSCPPGMASLGSTQHSSASSDADCKRDGSRHVLGNAISIRPVFFRHLYQIYHHIVRSDVQFGLHDRRGSSGVR